MPDRASLGVFVCLAILSTCLLYCWGRADGARQRAETELEALSKIKQAADEKIDQSAVIHSESLKELEATKRELYRTEIELRTTRESKLKLEKDLADERNALQRKTPGAPAGIAAEKTIQEVKDLVLQIRDRQDDHRTVATAQIPPCGKIASTAKDQAHNCAASQVPPGVSVERDLQYVSAGGCSRTLDLYIPKSDKPLPILVWIFGTGWSVGDKEDRSLAIPFSSKGYAVACINYRLSGEAKFPAQIEDCKAAIRWLKANATRYNIDPYKVGVWGASSGGHLAALLGTSGDIRDFDGVGENKEISSRVQAVCDFYGPTDFLQMAAQAPANSAIQHNSPGSPESGLIGGPIQDNKEKTARANPIKYITKDAPPFLIVHGVSDNIVPLGQSALLAEALEKAGVETTFQRIRSGHGGTAFERAEISQMVQIFFDRHLKGEETKAEPIKDQETTPENKNHGFPGSRLLRSRLPA